MRTKKALVLLTAHSSTDLLNEYIDSVSANLGHSRTLQCIVHY